jgi:hypothetical protein
MQKRKNKWKGLRALIVVRQSNDKEGPTSTEAQLEFMPKELERVGMTYVDKEVLEGVSAVSPARITQLLQKLVKRKKERDDFDVIAWQVEDRATRGGGEFGMWLEHECKRHGLRAYFAGDDEFGGPYSSVVRVSKYEAAKEQSVGNSRRTTQGQSYAMKRGYFRTSGHTPIGCDRIYYGEDNQPKYVIHNLNNGLQEQRDYATGNVIGRYGTVGKKSHNRLRKQRNEYSLLIPSIDREQRQLVRVIFYLRYKRGWRGTKIAGFLNRMKVPSPKLKAWSQRQVEVNYGNEAYMGCTYNDQTYSGRFNRRDRVLGFVALDRDELELAAKKTFAPTLRPMGEWDRINQPHMVEFLPKDVRDLAIAAQIQMWQERTDPDRKPKTPNANPASTFLLSNRLRAIQDGETLIGTMSGRPDHKVPYYRHRRSKRAYIKGSAFNNLIPAEPLHESIIHVLADALVGTPELREKLKQHLLEQRTQAHCDQPDVAKLTTEREELQKEIQTIVSSLRGAALATVQQQLETFGNRLNAIEAQLKQINAQHTSDQRPIDKVIDEAMRVLEEDRQRLLTLPIESLRGLVNQLITDATVDMATKAVELTIALPTWSLLKQPKTKKKQKNAENQEFEEIGALCPVPHSQSSTDGWTHQTMMLFRCEYHWARGSHTQLPCFNCKRRAA